MESEQSPAAQPAERLTIQEALRRSVQQAPVPFAITRGAEHTLVYANSAFARLAGFSGPNALGAAVVAAFDGNSGRALQTLLDRSFRDAAELLDERIDASGETADGWLCSVWPVVDDEGRVEGLGVQIREPGPPESVLVLQQQIAEQMLLGALRERGFAEDAETARRHAAFLAEAGRLLSESVDQASTFVALAKLALPILGSWCIMDVLDPGGEIHRLGIYHPDPEKQALARELQNTWLPERDDPFGAPAMLREARTITIVEDIEAILATTARSSEHMHLLRRLGIRALLTVPLIARRKLLGAITFVSTQRGVSYSQEDVQLAEDLAARAALALDNAQAYDLALMSKRSAEVANSAKTAFLGAMSHELRTPLNAIGGYIDLLDLGLRGPVTEAQHADFARVKANQQHLSILITEILSFARLASEGVSFAIADIDACTALESAVGLVEPLFAQKGVVFDGMSGDPGIVARADAAKVTQILLNLLANAIKFTPAGGHISTECTATTDTVHLHVSDTGIGIAPGELEAIFAPFTQLKEGLSAREGGVGLGLAISRDLARAMKGDLAAQSVEGKGSRFTLSLPRADGEQEG
jgi:signal transduction histidine kinase